MTALQKQAAAPARTGVAPVRAGRGLQFLYETPPGRGLLQLINRRWLSRLIGKYLDSPLSRRHIAPFVAQHGIDLSQFEAGPYASYNAFFTRRVLPACRPIDQTPDALISPCDAKLSAYPIGDDRFFTIKGARYTVAALLKNERLAAQYAGGWCLIFRLCVDDYHRYCFVDDGRLVASKYLSGVLHTVRPIAFDRYDVYHENCREYAVLETAHFGRLIQMEVGALLVGKISNRKDVKHFRRGEEKGMFEFGGSTVVLLTEPRRLKVDSDILENTAAGMETIVKMGERIGTGIRF